LSPNNPPRCIFCHPDTARPCSADGYFDPDLVAEAYIAYCDATDESKLDKARAQDLEWVVCCLYDLVDHATLQAFQIVLLAMNLLKERRQAGVLAAGPLEQLIVDHGPELIGQIELLAHRSPRFRFLLSGVQSQGIDETEVWQRVLRARAAGPDMNRGDPLPPADGLHMFL